MDHKPTLTLYELNHVSMLLPDPVEHLEDEYRLTYRYDINRTADLTFIRAEFAGRIAWIFTGSVLLPPIFNIEFETG